jgi:hypothetical protein
MYFKGTGKVVDNKVYRTRDGAERALPAFKAMVCDDEVLVLSALDPNSVRVDVVEQEFVDE